MGRAGLRWVELGGRREVELAYAVMSAEWGQGFATEMARAIIALGFIALELPDIVSFTLETNRASQRVMEKTGFRYEGRLVHAGLPHVLYRLARTSPPGNEQG